MHRLRAISCAVAVAFLAILASAEPVSQLKPSNYVNDFAGVLSASTESSLNNLCRQIDEKAKAQIAVVTVKSTDGEEIFNYSVDLYQKWGLGKKGSDRGVLILLAVNDRKYYIQVGYGLEPILPDGKVGGFGREAVPYLRQGDYSGAVALLTSQVADVIAKDAGVTLEGAQRARPPTRQAPKSGLGSIIILIIFVLIFLALSRAGRGGGGGGFWSGLLLGTLLNSMGGRGGGRDDWGGGGFGGGGGGFGGFGGGSTGGGGAGGSW